MLVSSVENVVGRNVRTRVANKCKDAPRSTVDARTPTQHLSQSKQSKEPTETQSTVWSSSAPWYPT